MGAGALRRVPARELALHGGQRRFLGSGMDPASPSEQRALWGRGTPERLQFVPPGANGTIPGTVPWEVAEGLAAHTSCEWPPAQHSVDQRGLYWLPLGDYHDSVAHFNK